MSDWTPGIDSRGEEVWFSFQGTQVRIWRRGQLGFTLEPFHNVGIDEARMLEIYKPTIVVENRVETPIVNNLVETPNVINQIEPTVSTRALDGDGRPLEVKVVEMVDRRIVSTKRIKRGRDNLITEVTESGTETSAA